MYWSAEHSTYLPANASQTAPSKSEPEEGAVVDRKKVEKVKTAKNIAKQMEKWAKTLNQKKEKSQTAAVSTPEPEKSKIEKAREALNRSEDIAFSIMQGKPMPEAVASSSSSSRGLDRLTGYGSDSAEEEPQQRPTAAAAAAPPDDSQLTDWSKMACLLCQRQFPSKEKLQK